MERLFDSFANTFARMAGSPAAFLICVAVVVAWAVSGPFFGFSETWQLVINTGTTIVTFLMVFLIQNTQNRDGVALQTKLDELIRSSNAEDDFIGIEKLTDRELIALHERCEAAAKKSQETLEKAQTERKRRGHHDHRVHRGSNARSIDP
ncbi:MULTISPECIES: low affinity iron permease family protein [unclassified Variovorax]|uniref:low affinity iron permease family protein n=1 Tax=unclassified Variovorax TaxID=663243 RepID=UPI003F482E92